MPDVLTQRHASHVPPAVLAHQWFEWQAACRPDATAAELGDQRVTYAQLNDRADALARVLADAGAGVGTFVGIAVQRSVAMLAAVLGTLKAGATYVPLDLSHPMDRIAMILEDTAAPLILADPLTRGLLPPASARLIDVTALPNEPGDGATAPAAAGPDSVAYVTYTSGSTGRPKGILMPHRAVNNLVAWQLDRYFPWPEGYRTLQFASLSFDVSFQEIFSTFASGGTLVLITEAERRDLHGLADLLNRKRIQRLLIPSVALQQVAEGYCAGGPAPSTLDIVIAGSEQLMITSDLRRLFTALPRCRLHNEYGPSETHVVTAYSLPPDPAMWPSRVPIGRPIANAQVHVLDADRRPTAPGSPGELYIGGAGLAHGYLRRPRQTAAAFVPDPFSEQPPARLYRTGDIARTLPSGDLEFLGRADEQLKIRGFRVEPGEVEANIAAYPGVRSAFVKGHGDEAARRRLVAYVVLDDENGPDAAELRDFLGRKLPEHMVPAAFMFLDRFPLSVNGKIDQRKLPGPRFGGTDRGTTYLPPRDHTEQVIAAEIADLLDVARIGVDDDFFALGGYSLVAAKLLRTVQKRFSVELQVADFYKQPTVAGLAGRVRQLRP
jgi:amino acid adenylation domain-containing protein